MVKKYKNDSRGYQHVVIACMSMYPILLTYLFKYVSYINFIPARDYDFGIFLLNLHRARRYLFHIYVCI